MGRNVLLETAMELVADGKGILAADESDGTIRKRFDSIGVESTEDSRRAYREMLFTTRGRRGVHQRRHPVRRDDPPEAADGTPFPELLGATGHHPGDQGRQGREAARAGAGRDGHRGPRRAARAARGVPRARRAVRQVARHLLDRRRHCPAQYCVWTSTPTRSRATPRCARRRGWCRSSSPRC